MEHTYHCATNAPDEDFGYLGCTCKDGAKILAAGEIDLETGVVRHIAVDLGYTKEETPKQ